MRELHKIHRDLISPNALKVIARLESEGFAAYLVGGGVRDILLGESPKDFDISTDAHPEQIRQLFRNSRIIGRRFRIVHVLFGREVIEVTTFRGHHPEPTESGGNRQSTVSEAGRLLRDNVYGSIEEDALRRDFTINALYYSPSTDNILDFCHGLNDLQNRRLALIGEPHKRYREDPVRMLRAVRFQARLDFELNIEVITPIDELAPLLHDIPPARMFDEVLKLFMSGAAVRTFHALRRHNLFGYLFPACERILRQENTVAQRFIELMLRNTDLRVQQGKPVTPAFLYGAFLWPATLQHHHALILQGETATPAMQQAGSASIEHQLQYTSIPRRFSSAMREIWELQQRLQQPKAGQVEQLVSLQRFRAAYDFLVLREEAGEETSAMGDWWTRYQEATAPEKESLTRQLGPRTPRKRKPRKRRRTLQPPLSDQVP